jgi:hypothetical protein
MSLSIRQLTQDDFPSMEALSTLFGDAFNLAASARLCTGWRTGGPTTLSLPCQGRGGVLRAVVRVI